MKSKKNQKCLEVNFNEACSLIDGEAYTDINNICKMINYMFEIEVMTHEIPYFFKQLKQNRPHFLNLTLLDLSVLKSEYPDFYQRTYIMFDKKYSNKKVKLYKL